MRYFICGYTGFRIFRWFFSHINVLVLSVTEVVPHDCPAVIFAQDDWAEVHILQDKCAEM